jgi:hypothetical protein
VRWSTTKMDGQRIFWDRSIDYRGKSCSTFLAEGTHTFVELAALANVHFPTVTTRFKFPIVDATDAVA